MWQLLLHGKKDVEEVESKSWKSKQNEDCLLKSLLQLFVVTDCFFDANVSKEYFQFSGNLPVSNGLSLLAGFLGHDCLRKVTGHSFIFFSSKKFSTFQFFFFFLLLFFVECYASSNTPLQHSGVLSCKQCLFIVWVDAVQYLKEESAVIFNVHGRGFTLAWILKSNSPSLRFYSMHRIFQLLFYV